MKKAVATPSNSFRFKQFEIHQDQCTMKVGTDGVLLGAWADVSQSKRILDIGTGSGVIALMLAQRAQEADIHGVEIDPLAQEQAAMNAEHSLWGERITIFPGAIQDFARQHQERYDLVVSNPPFFSGGTLSANHSRNEVRHTVKLPSGELLHAVRMLLKPEGRFCVILPFLEGLRFAELAASYNLPCTRMTEVFPKPSKPVSRLLLQFESEAHPLVKSKLVIQEVEEHNWTDEYKALTDQFYLDM